MKLLLRWFLYAATLILMTRYVPGISIAGFYSALVVALVLGLLNALVRPILIFLTLPISLVTLGLFTFIINALLFWFASTVVKGFDITGFAPAFWGALIMWAVAWLTNSLLSDTH